MTKIFATAFLSHDHSWYSEGRHYQVERYTRLKQNIKPVAEELFYKHQILPNIQDKVLAISTTDNFYFNFKDLIRPYKEDLIKFKPKKLWDHYYKDNIYYIDHHQSHAVYPYLMSGFKESDILAIDGGGVNYKCTFFDKDQNLIDLSSELPLGTLWQITSDAAGFGLVSAGKLMGLAAYGSFNGDVYEFLEILHDQFNFTGQNADIVFNKNFKNFVENNNINPQEIAFTMQQYTYDKIKEVIPKYKTSDNLCIGGGVGYNGYMNTLLLDYYKNVFIPPALGDEGQALGNYMHADYIINNNIHIPNVYSGKAWEVKEEIFKDMKYKQMPYNEIYDFVAKKIANGAIVGWYQGKSESGNRALGNRSIVADPRNPEIKNIINSKIKLREDFRPFAPSVLEEYYQEYFDTNQPSPYMSRIMPVLEDKKSIIPGVVHVDGTARIQTVTPEQNVHWYNLISSFYKETGVPMVVNTSFNCQEPMVETPEDALATFKKVALDILVINDYVIVK
jgi:carbamoyltransferase